jgi:serine protease Do
MLLVCRCMFAVAVLAVVGLAKGNGEEVVTKGDPATPPNAPAEKELAAKPPASSPMSLPGVESLVRRVQPSVVVVSFSDRDGTKLGVGSGVIIRSDGLVATNLHVLGEARPVKVQLLDGRTFDVQQVFAHEKSQDLAIVKIDAKDLPALELGDSAALLPGQSVVALGNPFGLEHSVVTGVVSALRENVDGMSMIQLAIPIERGNSGGPVVDAEGRVVGLLTLKSLVTENLGYAVAVNSLKPLLENPNPIAMSKWLTIGVLNPKHWQVLGDARWTQRSGRLRADGGGSGFGGRSLCLSKVEPPAIPFEAAVAVKMTEDDGAAGMVFHSDGADRHYGFYPSNGKLRVSRFDGPTVYEWHVLWEERRPEYREGEWNELKIRVEEDRVRCLCNGTVVYELTDDTYRRGSAGLAKFRHTTAEFKGFRLAEQIAASTIDAAADQLLSDIIARSDDRRPPRETDVASLVPLGTAAGPAALREAEQLERRAAWLRNLATSSHEARIREQIVKALSPPDGEPDLLTASLLIGALDDDEIDVAFYRREIEDFATELRGRFRDGMTESEKLAELHRLMFDDYGFHGSRTNYNSASNSHLNEVIDDREGLPITLSVVYMEIARRVGLKVDGVGLPGHFVARFVPAEGSPQLVDVYDRGEFLSRDRAMALVISNDVVWDESFLDAVTPKQIVVRILVNLRELANSQRDTERLLRYVETILAIEPESVSNRLLRAVICFNTGRLEEGLADAEWVIARHPDGVDLAVVHQLRDAIMEKLSQTPKP